MKATRKFKRGYGRHATTPRSRLLNIRVTDQEYQSIKWAMDNQRCRTVSEWIRRKASMGGDSPQFRIERVAKIKFCAGHRVYGHESKCKTIHGHNYVALFHARRKQNHLDKLGRVIDLSVLNERIGGWIDEHWDHAFIAYEKDLTAIHQLKGIDGQLKPVFILSENPTVENMAAFLLHVVCPEVLKETSVEVVKVELWETDNCKAEVTLYE